jgi:hypothetical protein
MYLFMLAGMILYRILEPTIELIDFTLCQLHSLCNHIVLNARKYYN